ncbi:hypothetical protein ACIQRE_01745 [Streptomyces griseoluteus]|uniref:hypothetical protein n=1 Tax=Streptomyces griseoluteus TaxID=29306 RepID=UPI0038066FF6
MSVPKRTGRARPDKGCRWCGPREEIVKFEIQDPETGGIGSEVMCCLCGRHQWRWGWEHAFWARETRREIVRRAHIGAWLAAQIIALAQRRPRRMRVDEAAFVREHVWPPSWRRHFDELPGPFVNCACQRPPSLPCQRGDHRDCQYDGHPVRETVVQTHAGRAAQFTESFQHRPLAGSAGRRDCLGTNRLAWVWLAGRPCREICTCVCHASSPATPAEPPRPEQLGLFTPERVPQ